MPRPATAGAALATWPGQPVTERAGKGNRWHANCPAARISPARPAGTAGANTPAPGARACPGPASGHHADRTPVARIVPFWRLSQRAFKLRPPHRTKASLCQEIQSAFLALRERLGAGLLAAVVVWCPGPGLVGYRAHRELSVRPRSSSSRTAARARARMSRSCFTVRPRSAATCWSSRRARQRAKTTCRQSAGSPANAASTAAWCRVVRASASGSPAGAPGQGSGNRRQCPG